MRDGWDVQNAHASRRVWEERDRAKVSTCDGLLEQGCACVWVCLLHCTDFVTNMECCHILLWTASPQPPSRTQTASIPMQEHPIDLHAAESAGSGSSQPAADLAASGSSQLPISCLTRDLSDAPGSPPGSSTQPHSQGAAMRGVASRGYIMPGGPGGHGEGGQACWERGLGQHKYAGGVRVDMCVCVRAGDYVHACICLYKHVCVQAQGRLYTRVCTCPCRCTQSNLYACGGMCTRKTAYMKLLFVSRESAAAGVCMAICGCWCMQQPGCIALACPLWD